MGGVVQDPDSYPLKQSHSESSSQKRDDMLGFERCNGCMSMAI